MLLLHCGHACLCSITIPSMCMRTHAHNRVWGAHLCAVAVPVCAQANRVRIIEKLVSMLDGTEGSGAQEEAAAALAKLAQDSLENRNSIVDAGGIRPLLGLLHSPSAMAKENSVSAITSLAQGSKQMQVALTKEGGVPLIAKVLVTAASGNAKELLAAAQLCSLVAQAISQLTEGNLENQTKMAEAGAIPPLVNMLAAVNQSLQANSAAALSALAAHHPENQGIIAKTGAIAPLCTLVREGWPEAQEQSAQALWALSEGNSSNKSTIAKLGGIEPLVALLVGAQSEQALKATQRALISLSSKHADNREAIAKLLVAKMNSRIAMLQSQGGAVRVLSTVAILAEDATSNQAAMAKAGAMPLLIMWLSGGFDARDFNEHAQRQAAHALLSMGIGNSAVQSLIVKSAGVPPLIDIVGKGKLEARKPAARVLWLLASGSQAAALISTGGGIRPLVSMLSVEDQEGQAISAAAISRLAHSSPSVALSVCEQGGVPPLVQLCRHGTHETQQHAAASLAGVAGVVATRDVIAEAGGIAALVPLLKTLAQETRETAARALANLARDGAEEESDVGQAEGAQQAEPAGVGAAATALSGAAATALGGVAATALGGAAATVLGDDAGAQNHASRASPRTAGDDEAGATASGAGAMRRQMIANAGGIEQLIQMLRAGEGSSRANTSHRGSVANHHASRDAARASGTHRASVADASEAMEAAKRSRQSGKEHAMLGVPCMAAKTLSDLSDNDADMQDAIIEAGGVPPLLNLLKTGSPRSQEYAISAIWHLCHETYNQKAVVECGVIVELVALSKAGSAKAQGLAAAVISDLAKGAIVEREQAIEREKSMAVAMAARRGPVRRGSVFGPDLSAALSQLGPPSAPGEAANTEARAQADVADSGTAADSVDSDDDSDKEQQEDSDGDRLSASMRPRGGCTHVPTGSPL